MELKPEVDNRTPPLRKATKYREKPPKDPKPPEQQNGNGTLLEPSFDLERLYEQMEALSVEFLNKNFTERTLRNLCQAMRDTLERCSKRLQVLEANRTALLCDHCNKVLPNGRFAGEIVIRDDITNELRALRACSESCYREVSRVANERRQRHQGSIRGTVAM